MAADERPIQPLTRKKLTQYSTPLCCLAGDIYARIILLCVQTPQCANTSRGSASLVDWLEEVRIFPFFSFVGDPRCRLGTRPAVYVPLVLLLASPDHTPRGLLSLPALFMPWRLAVRRGTSP